MPPSRTAAGLGLIGFLALLAGCGGEEAGRLPGTGSGRPVVYTTFYPTTYFAQRLAGDRAEVVCPVPDDEDPIFWKPDEETIRAYQEADLIVVNGAGFEKWVGRTSLPEARVVDTARPFEQELLTYEAAVEHTHGPAGQHAHEGIDGHTWLDPQLAKIQATEIARALKRLLPDEAEALEDRLAALHADLDGLDAGFRALTEEYRGGAIYASHPAYNYLARRYAWSIVSLDLDPEVMPDDATIAEIRARLAATPARHILWESAPRPAIADRLREDLGLESVEFSPAELLAAGDRAAGRDYLTVMRQNLERLAPVLGAR